ncbi:MAG: DegT/DnrJ/EryC1/StrS family aminotransferase [Phycisphaerae bacterium]|nr:DegT/DnrJ/EryC1/StrS family aminotransferase [Phycisphaerae bacterium]
MSECEKKVVFPREFPGVHWYGPEEEAAACRVIRERSPFRYYGASFLAEADTLEKEFSARLGRRYAQAMCSCTNALSASMAAFGIGPGQEVLVPGFFWVATVGPIVRAGGIPVLVEMGDDFNMDPEDLARKITPKSKLIIVVHMAGVPCQMPAIMEVAKSKGVPVLEDCAQANGASLNGKHAGSFGQAAAFSVQMNKNITAGEGGLFVTDDETLFLRANAAHDVGVPWKNGAAMQDSEHALWGAGSRMSELAASVVRAQLKKIDTIVGHMRDSKVRIKAALSDLQGITWRRVDDPKGDSGPFIIATVANEDAAGKLAAEATGRGLTCIRISDYGMHVYYHIKALVEKRSNSADGFPWTHPANVPLVRDYRKGALPKTDALIAKSVILPVPSRLTPELEQAYITIFRESYAKATK